MCVRTRRKAGRSPVVQQLVSPGTPEKNPTRFGSGLRVQNRQRTHQRYFSGFGQDIDVVDDIVLCDVHGRSITILLGEKHLPLQEMKGFD